MHSVGFQLHLDAFHRCRALLFQDDKEFTVAVYSKNLAATLNFSTLEVFATDSKGAKRATRAIITFFIYCVRA